ncbi:KpsF/GutQ family sugar-phosphate isomerase [Roseobacteraceae bacterium S113]
MSDQAIEAAQRVIATEAAGLAELAAHLPADFARFIDAVMACAGRVVVVGVGKSAHIGHKISATLASTGTPSHFVHATEASHGDLGMIVPGDICIIISKSGETTELSDAIAYCQRFGIPMAAICARPESTLARAATYLLLVPEAAEACSIGMAPTTSSTITLVLGDAIAVALMERRGFTPERFKFFHPGGKLGLQLATVGQLMHGGARLPLVEEGTPVREALLVMTAQGFGAALVVKDGALTGIVTDGDLRRHMEHLMTHSVEQIATKAPLTVGPEAFALEAMGLMNERKINVMAVVDEAARPVGILHMHDLLRAGMA